MDKKIWDIGHSNLAWADFLHKLQENKIECLIDIRRFPVSRLSPHFCRECLQANLEKSGIEYLWLGESLGGFRKQGYKAWMTTAQFREGLEKLEAIAREKRVAIMCAEKYFGRCHRRWLLQALAEKGWQIDHLS